MIVEFSQELVRVRDPTSFDKGPHPRAVEGLRAVRHVLDTHRCRPPSSAISATKQ